MKGKLYLILLLTGVAFAFQNMVVGEWNQPKHFPVPVYNFGKNPLSEAKILLGRALFYDPILSRDSTISCASCHSPYNAFAHTDHDLSHGIDDQIGFRNAPALFNLAWQKTFMWDGAINHLDMQALAPISNSTEMDESIANVMDKLNRSIIYPSLSYDAFQDSTLTGEYVLKALSQFQLSLVSATSKYDAVKRGEVDFSEQEESGYRLFQQNCNSCHQEPLFSTYEFANNGLPIDSTLNDFGKWRISHQTKDSLLFKIPSLRNLSFSHPYMHDGRFRKLNQVLQHYTTGIQESSILATELRKHITLSSNEKADLTAFLLTLNDKQFVFDKKHQFPYTIFFPQPKD